MNGAATPRVPRGDRTGTWFADDRGVDRRLKVSWHPERQLLVLSVWHGDTCSATFRLRLADVPRLVGTLVDVLGHAAASRVPAGGTATPAERSAWATSMSVASRALARTRARTQGLPDAWRSRFRRDE